MPQPSAHRPHHPTPGPGTAAVPSIVSSGVSALGRGVGQIFLQPRALTGLLIVAGIAVYSPLMALQVVLGTTVSTVAGRLLDLRVSDGLQGYNGALVGAAAWAAMGVFWPATLLTVVGAAACPAVHRALERALAPLGLPALTAPFCIVSGLLTALLRAIDAPMVPDPAPVSGSTAWLVPEAVLTGESQVVLVDSWVGGALILAGLFIAGWRVGTAALLGSVVGTAATLALVPAGQAAHGLGGYSPCLTAIAIGVVLLPPGRRAWVLAVAGSVLTVVVDRVFTAIPVPTYTWPFIVTTWLVLAVVNWRERRLG